MKFILGVLFVLIAVAVLYGGFLQRQGMDGFARRVCEAKIIFIFSCFLLVGFAVFRTSEEPQQSYEAHESKVNSSASARQLDSCYSIALRVENRPIDLFPTVESLASEMRRSGGCR